MDVICLISIFMRILIISFSIYSVDVRWLISIIIRILIIPFSIILSSGCKSRVGLKTASGVCKGEGSLLPRPCTIVSALD